MSNKIHNKINTNKETKTDKSKKVKHTKVSSLKLNNKNIKNKKLSHSAILGGGDIAFALLFTGTALASFYSSPLGLIKTLIVTLFATIGVSTILFLGKKGRFYPAMPFVTLGCFVGYLVAWLV